MKEERKPSETPYLHVRAPKRVVGVGGEGDRAVARICGNRAGLLALREQVDRALEIDEGMASERTHYLEVDGREFDLWVMRATSPQQMGEPREPERPDRPDRSMFT